MAYRHLPAQDCNPSVGKCFKGPAAGAAGPFFLAPRLQNSDSIDGCRPRSFPSWMSQRVRLHLRLRGPGVPVAVLVFSERQVLESGDVRGTVRYPALREGIVLDREDDLALHLLAKAAQDEPLRDVRSWIENTTNARGTA